MIRRRVDEYQKYGFSFYGKLVVFDYYEEMRDDPNFGMFGKDIISDYINKTEELAKELYRDFEVLLTMPEYVIRLK